MCHSPSWIRRPTESGSNPDPQHWSYGYDPEHCFKVNCPLLLIQFESGFNWISGSGSGLGIRIQAGKNCPPKKGKLLFWRAYTSFVGDYDDISIADPDPNPDPDPPDPDPNPDPDPPDPHIFGPPGSGSTSQRYGSGSGSCSGFGSGSFYHHAKIVRKTLSYYFVTLIEFLSLKNDVNVASKSHKQKKLC